MTDASSRKNNNSAKSKLIANQKTIKRDQIGFKQRFSGRKSQVNKDGIIQLLKNQNEKQKLANNNISVKKNQEKLLSKNHSNPVDIREQKKRQIIANFNRLKEPDYYPLNRQFDLQVHKEQKINGGELMATRKKNSAIKSQANQNKQLVQSKRRVSFTGEQLRKISKTRKSQVKDKNNDAPKIDYRNLYDIDCNQGYALNKTEENENYRLKKGFDWDFQKNIMSPRVSNKETQKNSVSPLNSYPERVLSPHGTQKNLKRNKIVNNKMGLKHDSQTKKRGTLENQQEVVQKNKIKMKIKSQSSISYKQTQLASYSLDKYALKHLKYLQKFEIRIKNTQKLLKKKLTML